MASVNSSPRAIKEVIAEDSVQTFTHKTIDTQNTHGTGCTLSSAITSFIARGLELISEDSVQPDT